MANAKHVKIEHETFGDTRGEKTVKLAAHISPNGDAYWLCFTCTRDEMIRLAAELNAFALDENNWIQRS